MIKSWVNNPQSHDMIIITHANPLKWDPSHNQILPSNPTELCPWLTCFHVLDGEADIAPIFLTVVLYGTLVIFDKRRSSKLQRV